MSEPSTEFEPLHSDVSDKISGQAFQVASLRFCPLLLTWMLLFPIMLPAGEEVLTSSGAFWGPLFLLVTAGLGQLFSATEARALACAQREGGSDLRVDADGLNLPFLATIGPARDRAIKAGRPLLVIPWSEVRGVTTTRGDKGIPSIKIELADEPGWVLAADHVYLRCDALGSGHKDRILSIARDRAGRDPATGEAPSEPVVLRPGLTAKRLRANRMAVVGVGVASLAGLIGGGLSGMILSRDVAVAVVLLLVMFGPLLWKFEMELAKRGK